MRRRVFSAIIAGAFFAGSSVAQVAGGGADSNESDREATANEAELQRLLKIDPPLREDPIGNALIGGAVTGTLKGAAAGAAATVRGAAGGSAVQLGREAIEETEEPGE